MGPWGFSCMILITSIVLLTRRLQVICIYLYIYIVTIYIYIILYAHVI